MHSAITAFLKSVLIGSLFGGGPMLLVSLPLAVIMLGEARFVDALYIFMLPFMIAFPLVLLASIAIGLPLTFFAQRAAAESELLYTAVGIVAGALFPILGLLAIRAEGGYFISMLGAVSGAATGRTWWRANAGLREEP